MPSNSIAKNSSEGARAILRVPDVLLAVAASGERVAFAQLQEVLGLPKGSLHRLLHTLERAGFLERVDGLYALGPASVSMAEQLLFRDDSNLNSRTFHQILEWLSRASGESAIIAELGRDGDEVFYIDVINSEKSLRVTVPTGHTRPLYAAASGQVILAYLPDDQREAYFRRTKFEQLTSHTLDEMSLRKVMAQILGIGLAIDRGGSFLGAGSVAAPCFDQAGRVRCAVSIAGPQDRLESDMNRHCALVLEAGRRVSSALGYRGSYPRHER